MNRTTALAGQAPLVAGGGHEPRDGRVVGLGGPGGEDDLVGAAGAEGAGQAAPGPFHGIEGRPARAVEGVGIGPGWQVRRPRHPEGLHGPGRLLAERSRGGVVEVDGELGGVVHGPTPPRRRPGRSGAQHRPPPAPFAGRRPGRRP